MTKASTGIDIGGAILDLAELQRLQDEHVNILRRHRNENNDIIEEIRVMEKAVNKWVDNILAALPEDGDVAFLIDDVCYVRMDLDDGGSPYQDIRRVPFYHLKESDDES